MINLFIFGHGVVIYYFLACLRSTFFSLLKQLYFKCSLSTIVQTFELDWLLNLRSGWLGQAMVLGSFQCRGVLLLWHMVGQGPAVLSAGAGWVGFFCVCFFFILSILSSFSNVSSVGRWLDILKYCGLGCYNPAVVVSYYQGRARQY